MHKAWILLTGALFVAPTFAANSRPSIESKGFTALCGHVTGLVYRVDNNNRTHKAPDNESGSVIVIRWVGRRNVKIITTLPHMRPSVINSGGTVVNKEFSAQARYISFVESGLGTTLYTLDLIRKRLIYSNQVPRSPFVPIKTLAAGSDDRVYTLIASCEIAGNSAIPFYANPTNKRPRN